MTIKEVPHERRGLPALTSNNDITLEDVRAVAREENSGLKEALKNLTEAIKDEGLERREEARRMNAAMTELLHAQRDYRDERIRIEINTR